MGGGVGSIESAMKQLFQNARDEILLTVYSISNRTDLLFDWLEWSFSRGVEDRIVINKFGEPTQFVTEKLLHMATRYPHLFLYNFEGKGWSNLHAKVIVVDRNKAVVGSSNLSQRGMLTNYELAVLIEGAEAVTAAKAVDRLIASANVTRI